MTPGSQRHSLHESAKDGGHGKSHSGNYNQRAGNSGNNRCLATYYATSKLLLALSAIDQWALDDSTLRFSPIPAFEHTVTISVSYHSRRRAHKDSQPEDALSTAIAGDRGRCC